MDQIRYWWLDRIPVSFLNSQPNQQALMTCAESIGLGWELLAVMLGVESNVVEAIKLDNPYNTQIQIFRMLMAWRQKFSKQATFERLFLAIYESPVSVNVMNLFENVQRKMMHDGATINSNLTVGTQRFDEPPPSYDEVMAMKIVDK